MEAQRVLGAQAEVTERCRCIAWSGAAGLSLPEI
jgi:hypothetical protein